MQVMSCLYLVPVHEPVCASDNINMNVGVVHGGGVV